jgi:hypothetical protein
MGAPPLSWGGAPMPPAPASPGPGAQVRVRLVEIMFMTTNDERAAEVFDILRLALAEQAITLAQDEKRTDETLASYLERTAAR